MNWEAIGALSTALTGLVIAATVLVGFRELRIGAEHAKSTRDQLEHLRKATQFEGVIAVFAELDQPLQVAARHYVKFQLADRLKEERYRYEVGLFAGADEREHQELTVLRCFERIGLYVDKGFVDPDIIYLIASGRVITTWRALEETVQIHRAIAGHEFWNHYERLYNGCKRWMKQHAINVDELEARQVNAMRH